MSVLLDTSHGTIVIDLFTDICPKACLNFLSLCYTKYYNNCIFFNVQKGLFIQTGDPEKQNGEGGESIWHFSWRMREKMRAEGEQSSQNNIQDAPMQKEPSLFVPTEIHPKIKFMKAGLVAMAGGPDFQSSQFFITTSDTQLKWLDGKCTIFGEVAEGMDVVHDIELIPVREKSNRPLQVVRIRHTSILFNPLSDAMEAILPMEWLKKPPTSPEPQKNFLDMLPEDLDTSSGLNTLSKEEIEKKIVEENAKSQLLFLHVSGFLPEEELKPPENILFVCRLNPKTKDDELELVFSQFGNIIHCNIVRDKDGVSLGYAFIEFESKEVCERAYSKMQNVMIDERRIVVDFAHSVSHIYHNRNRGISKESLDAEYDNRIRSNQKQQEVLEQSSIQMQESKINYAAKSENSQQHMSAHQRNYRKFDRSPSNNPRHYNRERGLDQDRNYNMDRRYEASRYDDRRRVSKSRDWDKDGRARHQLGRKRKDRSPSRDNPSYSERFPKRPYHNG